MCKVCEYGCCAKGFFWGCGCYPEKCSRKQCSSDYANFKIFPPE